ncbi:MAG TPA: hypothetical protein VIH40_05630 [Xanthobacteraceae bacterium]
MTYTLTLTAAEVDLVGRALDLLPFGRVAGLVENLRAQLAAAEAAAAGAGRSPTPDPFQQEPGPRAQARPGWGGEREAPPS